MRGVGRIIQIGFISMETKLIMAIRMATKLSKLMSSNSMGKRSLTKKFVSSMVKYLLFIITMTCCICCNSFRNAPTVKIRYSTEKDTLLKSFGISYIDLKGDKIIHISKRTSCILQPLETSKKGETNYFRLKLNKDRNTAYQIDSILSVGEIQYNPGNTGIIFPITKHQNEGDFSTVGEIQYFNTDELLADCIEKNLENSEAVCFDNKGLFCLYMNADTLFAYNISTKEKKSIFAFDNPMMYSVELKLKNNILTLVYYPNFVEDFSDFHSAKVINFDYHE